MMRPAGENVLVAQGADAGGHLGGQVVGQSYGGYKQSGIGREVSLEGMLAGFTQTKQVNIKLRS